MLIYKSITSGTTIPAFFADTKFCVEDTRMYSLKRARQFGQWLPPQERKASKQAAQKKWSHPFKRIQSSAVTS